jgi:hypothetical protein
MMVRNNEELTKTYNRFHNPHETSLDIRLMNACGNLTGRCGAVPNDSRGAYQWTRSRFVIAADESRRQVAAFERTFSCCYSFAGRKRELWIDSHLRAR